MLGVFLKKILLGCAGMVRHLPAGNKLHEGIILAVAQEILERDKRERRAAAWRDNPPVSTIDLVSAVPILPPEAFAHGPVVLCKQCVGLGRS